MTSFAIFVILACSFFPVCWSSPHYFNSGPPEDGLDWIDNTVVPEPSTVGSHWVYTPSRKAPLYAESYKQKLMKQQLRQTKTEGDLRLPNDVLPYRYGIQLLPFIEEGNFTIDGSIMIFVNCVRATRNITMNSANIVIDQNSIRVTDLAEGTDLRVENFSDEQSTREMITIQTNTSLEANKTYRISIKFTSILNEEMYGFYRVSYMENGVRKWLAVTDFEAPNARRAFPCFDEPNMKAEFSITLGRKRTMRTASNMPLMGTNPIPGMPDYVWDYFRTSSVRMPSYLTAFLISEFKVVSSEPGLARVPFRIWTRPDYVNYTWYSLDVAPRQQQHFEEYFGVNYSLPKQDLAAIPDFPWGAMENWGLITYRESYLLVNPATAPRTQYQSIATINAHELTHQWFGNIVTADWWNVVWLQEGFATYYEYSGTAHVEPDWAMEDQSILIDLHYAFGIDALETSRPMNYPVYTTEDMDTVFDGISYEKGACIIRMMSDMLGEETFRKGLKRYLDARAFDNAVQDDLWQALQQQANQDNIPFPATIKEIMETWTSQMGYPVIAVTRNYQTNTTLVSQSRFLLRKTEGVNDTHVYRWWVPLTYHTGNNPQRRVDWLTSTQADKSIAINGLTNDEWVLFNINQQNYYRVAYDARNYGLLAKQLNESHHNSSISIRNRAQLLDDAFNLALANVIPYKWAMDLSAYLEHETEYVPWRAVLTELDYIDIMLRWAPEFADWKKYMTKLVEPYYRHVGFEENNTSAHLTIYSRTDALNWACRLEIPECIEKAKNQYAQLMLRPNLFLSPNQRNFILRTGVEQGGFNEWFFAYDQYKLNGDVSFLTAMANTKDHDLVEKSLEMILYPNWGIRPEHVNTFFATIASTPRGNGIAFDFLVERWAELESTLRNSNLISFYYSLRNRLNTQEDLNRYIKLRDDHTNVLGSSSTVQMGIETVRNNVKWMELHQKEIGLWLKNFLNPTEPSEPSAAWRSAHFNWYLLSCLLIITLLNRLFNE